ncbi:MTH1187 family thiamine-binding protein [Evansella sp. AB-P1]|uniref:MTH1187 family thiamine-binding protein n=1 Tax=Evansella sp. AB-P1 TaxID=3037653 RepID=UPI00241E12F4|nr:MTH1187 family thiamine-binding protein [Evansella sp. AB-P1]MDG5788735.1 MTH1187 family thiamine-binding protein [Evansella sp. AB-P1]
MAIADITVIPIGSNTTSVSSVVAEIHRLLKSSDKEIIVELTPMSTLIEGDLPVLLEVIKEIHEVPFKLGHKRVATNIRIDDRRDRISSMDKKRNAVQEKLNTTDNE